MTEQDLATLVARAKFIPNFEPYGGAMAADGAYPYGEIRGPSLQTAPPRDAWGDPCLVVSEHYEYADVLCALLRYAKPTVLSLASELSAAWHRISELEATLREGQQPNESTPPPVEPGAVPFTLRSCARCGQPTAENTGICSACWGA